MMEQNNISAFMDLADGMCDKILREDAELLAAKRHAKADVAKALAAGWIKVVPPPAKPEPYRKKTEVVRTTNKFTDAEIRAKLAVIDELLDDGLTVIEACRVSGISQGNLGRWRIKMRELDKLNPIKPS